MLLAGGYAAALAGLIILGLIFSLFDRSRYPGNAVDMPFVALIIAIGLGAAAFGLYREDNRARLLFIAVAPWGALALASAFAGLLWRNDIPLTQFLFLVYAPIVFLLSRPEVLNSLNLKSDTWISRGAALLLSLMAVMLVARLIVTAGKPSGGAGFYGQLVSMNDYVKRLVLCIVPFWHYTAGFIAVAVPIAIRALKKRNRSL